MSEFTDQFLVEARELTEQATADLLALEQSPGQGKHLDDAFRAFHTLKGAAAIMEYTAMERLLHKAEDLLQGIRSGKQSVTPDVIDGSLGCLGQVIRWLDVIERTGEMPNDAEAAASGIAKRLVLKPQEVDEPPPSAWVPDLVAWSHEALSPATGAAKVAIRYVPATEAIFDGEDPVDLVSRLPGILGLRLSPKAPWPPLAELQPFNSNLIIEALSSSPRVEVARSMGSRSGVCEIVELAAVATPEVSNTGVFLELVEAQKVFVQARRPDEMFAGVLGSAGRVVANALLSLGRSDEMATIARATEASLAEGTVGVFVQALDDLLQVNSNPTSQSVSDEPTEGRREAGAGSIRIDVARVDAIVDLTGELLVVKNALAHFARVAAEGADPAELAAGLRTQHARLDRHVTELQRAVLELRVLPLARVFGRFPLLVRETATRLDKQVVFRSEGDDTEADKAVVEALFEPLLHVVRNAIDHGIEMPDARVRAGKPRLATIVMRGWREGDHVVVEVSDDGQGVDASAVRRAALSRGVATEDEVAALDDDDAVSLIFAPGFTTAATVTDLSGRGVGMNAVRSAVERMGGNVDLNNRPGQGFAIRFVLPFTVMMTRIMTVEANGQMFGIPFDAVQETVRVARSQIRPLGGGEAIVLRDLTIPVLSLATSLGLDLKQAPLADTACLVIAIVDGQRVGIEIDRPGERLDMMLKPVEGMLAGMAAISGTSLLGDGRVLIVLDLGALFR